MNKKPVVLMVLDGYGLNERTEGNAIAMADTPVMDKLMKECPFVKGAASGLAVGLPDGQMGNSEVGHMNIGAGRIIYQDLTKITKDINDGTFFENKVLLEAMENCKKNDSDLHLWGLLSDGGVHSHITHLYGLLEMAKKNGLSKVYVHAFLDGRDTPPASGKDYVAQLQEKMDELGVGKIASLSGRYYAMDRDNNWDRVQLAYDSLTKGEGVKADNAVDAMQASYDDGKTDEFVLPTVIVDENGAPLSLVKDKDSVIFFNFRPDRAREITRAFCDDKFSGFERPFLNLTYVCFKDYDETIPNKKIAFEKEELTNTFGEFLAKNGLKQLRLAETEKYAHVTFFFNGGVEEPNTDEFRLLVNSPKDVATYDLKPEMSAPEVGMDLVEAIKSDKYDVIVINFANPDMVGHTGVIPAAVKAVERVDALVGEAVAAVKEAGGVMFICADHGNAEKMIDYETGEPHTAHTTNPVPFILVNAEPSWKLREGGCLADIAPTLIDIMGMKQPAEMTGKSLLEYKPFKEGKVREVYDIGDNLVITATDRISAFDVILKNKVTDKGAILTQMSRFWFDFTKDILPNHMVSVDVKDMPEFFHKESFSGNSMMCKKLEMLPIECIVRGYITGSGWASYKENGTVCNIKLPEGLVESDKLPEPIYTPSTKAELGDHDENISFERSVEVLEKLYPGKGLDYATQIKDCTIALYKKCAEYALSKGIIIADTKFEFGLDENGKVVLGDEMLTPDSSRFWPLEGYEPGHGQPSFDKQFVRDWLKANPDSDYKLPEEVITKTVEKYKEAYKLLTGCEFSRN